MDGICMEGLGPVAYAIVVRQSDRVVLSEHDANRFTRHVVNHGTLSPCSVVRDAAAFELKDSA